MNTNVARTDKEIFDNPEKKFTTWKKGQIMNPRWLKRDISGDFITIKNEQDMKDMEQYLSGADERLACEYYNAFFCGRDSGGHRMIGLNDIDSAGDQKKIAIIIIIEETLALQVVEIIDTYCGAE